MSQQELFSQDEHLRALRHSDGLPDDMEILSPLDALVLLLCTIQLIILNMFPVTYVKKISALAPVLSNGSSQSWFGAYIKLF